MKISSVISASFLVLIISVSLWAVPLDSNQLYFDPDSIVLDFYPVISLPDLSVSDSYVWTAGGDDVVDADILPILKPGEYPPGYVYSQSDYLHQTPADYTADLTAGDLTVTFITPGLYHVRVVRLSGNVQIYAVYAQSWLKGSKAGKSGKSKKVDPVPNGDLFIVESPDSVMDDSAKVWQKNGRTVQRATSVQDTVNKIKAKSKALGRKIHVELDGHGNEGLISMGSGNDTNHRISLKNAASFQKSIDDYVKHITFQGCSIGAGEDGKKFLKIMAYSIGKAGAWDADVTVVDEDYFTVPCSAKFVEFVLKDKKKLQHQIPVVVNCVGTADPNVVNGLINGANKKLKGANVQLKLKQVNKNVAVGDANDTLNFDEIWNLRSKGKKELAKVVKNKRGRWTGKGLKIYVAKNCWKEQPTKDNWIWRKKQCIGVKDTIDPNTLAGVVRKYFDPNKVADPNYDEGAVAQIDAQARIFGDSMTAPVVTLNPGGTTALAVPQHKITLSGALLDDIYDITGTIDPCDPAYGYADIHSVAIAGTDLSDPNGQSTIFIDLDGVFPGTEPNPYMPHNMSRVFDATYTLTITGVDTGLINMRVWTETPDGPVSTLAWYEGNAAGHIGSLLITDDELVADPYELTDPNAVLTNSLELTVSNSILLQDGVMSLADTPVSIQASSNVVDEGLVLSDYVIEDGNSTFELTLELPHNSSSISLVAPADDANGLGLGITGRADTALVPVDIELDGDYIGTAITDEFGDFYYYADPLLNLAYNEDDPHLIRVSQPLIDGDTTDYQSASAEFKYIPGQLYDGDIDIDGDVDIYDFAIMADNWLKGK